MHNNKEVMISFYIESSKFKSDLRNDPMKRINPKIFRRIHEPSVIRTRGYDRRAQLLAYAQELRQANASPQIHASKLENKWRWLLPVQKIRSMFSRFYGASARWKYEPIITEDCYNADGSCSQQRMNNRKRKASGRRNSHFCKKLKCFLKGIWQCKNGIC